MQPWIAIKSAMTAKVSEPRLPIVPVGVVFLDLRGVVAVAEIVKILQKPDVRQKLQGLGIEPMGTSVESFNAFVKSEVPKWAVVVKEAGAKVE